MARFDVHENPADPGDVPLLVNVQNDYFADIRTRVVIPLVPVKDFGTPVRRLNPVFDIAGVRYALATTDIAGTDRYQLGKVVASLEAERDEITAAIDFLLQGF